MENLVSDGLELMVFGMGFVAVFLTVLVFATTGMSALVGKYFPEAPAQPKAKKAAPAAAAVTLANAKTIRVIVLGLAGGDEEVAEAVAPGAGEFCFGDEFVEVVTLPASNRTGRRCGAGRRRSRASRTLSRPLSLKPGRWFGWAAHPM